MVVLGLVGAVLAFALLIGWIVLPFMVAGIGTRVRRIEEAQQKQQATFSITAKHITALAVDVAELVAIARRREDAATGRYSEPARDEGVRCPQCMLSLSPEYSLAGKHACPHCGQHFAIE
ncbi:MAG: hypothetical protein FJ221_18130 [Lentisphaerae bacterium]|nr:hypothetical protein [Lentisphaerota bacterium]